ncbi:MAG: hypothetical protein ACFFCW_40915 [Candidatus Hodarchaeota archaeon]
MYVRVSRSYEPRRDIPIAVRKLKTFSPSRIRDWIRDHKTKRDKVTGKRVQLNVTPQSISMWFKRHPNILRKLKAEVKDKNYQRKLFQKPFSRMVFSRNYLPSSIG